MLNLEDGGSLPTLSNEQLTKGIIFELEIAMEIHKLNNRGGSFSCAVVCHHQPCQL